MPSAYIACAAPTPPSALRPFSPLPLPSTLARPPARPPARLSTRPPAPRPSLRPKVCVRRASSRAQQVAGGALLRRRGAQVEVLVADAARKAARELADLCPGAFFHVALDCPGYGGSPGSFKAVRTEPLRLLQAVLTVARYYPPDTPSHSLP